MNIFERQAPPPASQHIMDAIPLNEEKAAFVTEIVDISTFAALYCQRGGYYWREHGRGRGRGHGHGGSGRFQQQKTYQCTYRKLDNLKTKACGKWKHALSSFGNAGGYGN